MQQQSDSSREAESGVQPGSGTPNPRALKISIRSKLILVSALLLILAVGVFAAISVDHGRRNIDAFSERLRQTITENLRHAGEGQLNLLAAASRIALLQSDYGSLRTIVNDVKQQDPWITKVAIRSPDGTVIANAGAEIADADFSRRLSNNEAAVVQSDILVGKQRSIVLSTPVRYRDRLMCQALIAYSLEPLETELEKAEQRKQQLLASNLRNIAFLGAIVIALGILLTVIQGLRISRPIRALAWQANRVADGDFSARVEIASSDEIGQLGDTFNHMSHRIESLMQDAEVKAALEREFEIANSIQNSLVPESAAVSLHGMELAGFFQPASQCGGDWWSYYDIVEDKALIIIGDVTGHGIPAAMITALVKGAASTMISVSGSAFRLSDFLSQLNTVVYDAGRREFFMTCFVALYDPSTHVITYANAGHTFPYLYLAETQEMSALMARGTWLGYQRKQDYAIHTTELHRGDVLVWYTDGIVELENDDGEALGERRFRRMLRKNVQLAPDQYKDRIVTGVYEHAAGRPQQDDITLVVGRVCA